MRGYSYEFVKKVRALARSSSAPCGVGLGLRAIEAGISISEIARRLGVSRMAVYDWFTGKYVPAPQHQKKLNALLNIKPR